MDWLRKLMPSRARAPQPVAPTTVEGMAGDLEARVERLRALKAQPYRRGESIVDALQAWFALHVAPRDVYDPWRIPRDGPKADWPRLAAITTPQKLADLAAVLLDVASTLDADMRWQMSVHPIFMGPDLCRVTAQTLCATATELAQRTGEPLAMPRRCSEHLAAQKRELQAVSNGCDGLEIASRQGSVTPAPVDCSGHML